MVESLQFLLLKLLHLMGFVWCPTFGFTRYPCLSRYPSGIPPMLFLSDTQLSEHHINRSSIDSSIFPISSPDYTSFQHTSSGSNSARYSRPFCPSSYVKFSSKSICQSPYCSFEVVSKLFQIASYFTGLFEVCSKLFPVASYFTGYSGGCLCLVSILVCLLNCYLLGSKGGF